MEKWPSEAGQPHCFKEQLSRKALLWGSLGLSHLLLSGAMKACMGCCMYVCCMYLILLGRGGGTPKTDLLEEARKEGRKEGPGLGCHLLARKESFHKDRSHHPPTGESSPCPAIPPACSWPSGAAMKAAQPAPFGIPGGKLPDASSSALPLLGQLSFSSRLCSQMPPPQQPQVEVEHQGLTGHPEQRGPQQRGLQDRRRRGQRNSAETAWKTLLLNSPLPRDSFQDAQAAALESGSLQLPDARMLQLCSAAFPSRCGPDSPAILFQPSLPGSAARDPPLELSPPSLFLQWGRRGINTDHLQSCLYLSIISHPGTPLLS